MDEPYATSTENWTVSYWDSSGNGYRFTANPDGTARFVYRPVTPEQSSSGTYSGGDPCEATLEPRDVAALFERVNELAASSALHIEKRQMGTGQFRIHEGDMVRRFILRNGSALRAFNAFVVGFREV
ncbi:MAG: hypothetical protein AAF560_01195 [Acidobacteriota bacterium]